MVIDVATDRRRWLGATAARGGSSFGAGRWFGKDLPGGGELGLIAQEKELVGGLEVFVGAGVEVAGAGAVDADDGGAGAGAELEFTDALAEGG